MKRHLMIIKTALLKFFDKMEPTAPPDFIPLLAKGINFDDDSDDTRTFDQLCSLSSRFPLITYVQKDNKFPQMRT